MTDMPQNYREMREKWISWLDGDDQNSITRQLTQLTWDIAAFRSIADARNLAPKGSARQPQINLLLHNLLDRCFFERVMSCIRRLNDNYGHDGKRGVHSLRQLLNEIRAKRDLMTRSSIFAAEGLEYDLQLLERNAAQSTANIEEPYKFQYETSEEYAYDQSLCRHEVLDRLTGTTELRTPIDTISEQIIRSLISDLRIACASITRYVDKHIAHAATAESRRTVDTSIYVDDLWNAHRRLCQVASFVNRDILGRSAQHFLASPLFDQFEFISSPLVNAADVRQLQESWNCIENEVSEWANWQPS